MIYLNDFDCFASGVYQKCYRHPYFIDKCIKVSIDTNKEDSRLPNEIKHYKRVSKKNFKKFEYPFFAKFYREVATNLGTGLVFDLIRDETTGNISKTYRYYLMHPTDLVTDQMMATALDQLIHQMGKHKIIANDIRAKNICCQILKDNSIRFVLIDGIGHRDFFPFVNYSSFLAKKKIARRLKKFELESVDQQRRFYLNLRAKSS